MKKTFLTLLSIFVLTAGLSVATAPSVAAQGKSFTVSELSQFDGKEGRAAYFAFEGKVYDVTGSKTWQLGQHFGLQAGLDLTEKLDGAPHGTEVFGRVPMVGTLAGAGVATSEPVMAEVSDQADLSRPDAEKAWYEGRITFLGFSILGWTGISLGILFFLTFGTCFAMPWAKLPLPWKGTKIGPDALDRVSTHLTWSSIHKHFVWWLVVIGVIHGALGFMQMLGIYL